MLYAYSFQDVKRDLSDVLSTCVANQPRFISMFKPGTIAANQKHEWLEDQIAGRSLSVVGVDEMTLTASAADTAKVKTGTLLTVKDDMALFQVTAKNSATSFTVVKVAANGSVKTAPAVADILNIVSTPMAQATDNGDGEENYHFTGRNYNTTQIFRKDIVISGSALAIAVYGNVDNQINRQTAFALSELARDLNRVALFGRRIEPGAGVNGEIGGLYAFATGSGALAITGGDHIFDSYLVNDAAQTILAEGGSPDTIMCNPGQARVLSSEFKKSLQIVREDQTRGAYVAVIVNEVNGQTMNILADPDMPDTEAWVMDSAGFALSSLKGRGIADEDATPKGFDGIKRMALGELTLEFKNSAQRLCRIHGLKTSVSALNTLRSA